MEKWELAKLYIHLEDKYWALLLVGLLWLWMYASKEKEEGVSEKLRYLVGFGFLTYCIFYSGWTAKVVFALFPETSDYFELTYLVPSAAVLSVALVPAFHYAWKQGKKTVAVMLGGLFLLFFMVGDFAYLPMGQQEYSYECTSEEKDILEMMSEDAKAKGKENVYFWGMEELMFKSVFYGDQYVPIYERDILQDTGKYSEKVLEMREEYAAYVNPGNARKQLLACMERVTIFANLYSEVPCDYLVLYDPVWKLKANGKIKMPEADAITEITKAAGFELVGNTEKMYVFCKTEKEK